MSKKSDPKTQEWGKESCDWPRMYVFLVHSVYSVYEVATQWGGYVCLSDHPQISSLCPLFGF